jgi:cell wall-associated NlpC family hydrolase
LALAVALLCALPATAQAGVGGAVAGVAPAAKSGASSGGASAQRRPRPKRPRPTRTTVPAPLVATGLATLRNDGTAAPPAGAPAAVAAVIAAGNRIASLPYRWGGGHRAWEDVGYDCSGSVGYALHGGGLLDATSDSGGLMSYGDRGPGTWITIYANPGHVYMVVAGLRFDTSGARPSRWQATPRSTEGYAVRHPAGI